MAHHPGITVRHATGCAAPEGGICSCSPSYRAEVWSQRDGRKIRKTCRTLAEAKAWRADAMREIRLGTRRASAPLTVAAAAEAWLTGARSGATRNRSGDECKPSSIRGYEEALRIRVLPELGTRRLDTITRSDLQGLVDRLLAEAQHPSTIRNSLMPLRAIFRRTIARGDLAINPTRGLELPAVRGGRDRIVAPEKATSAPRTTRAGSRGVGHRDVRRPAPRRAARARAERHRARREAARLLRWAVWQGKAVSDGGVKSVEVV